MSDWQFFDEDGNRLQIVEEVKLTPDKTPQPKVVAGGIAGATALVIVWTAGQFGLEVPAEVAVAFSTLLSFAASYLKKSS